MENYGPATYGDRCLRNVAAHLDEGGRFVMDAWVPDPTRYRNDQVLAVNQVAADRVVLDVPSSRTSAGSVEQRGLCRALGLSGGVEGRLPAGLGLLAEEGLFGRKDEPFPGLVR